MLAKMYSLPQLTNSSSSPLLIELSQPLALTVLSVCVVTASIITEQTSAAENNIAPVLAIIIFWCCLLWLAMIEGGQGCLVGLQPTPKVQYALSHPISHDCTTLAHKGDNMERFIVGRQFLVVLIITTVNMMGSSVAGADVFTFGTVANNIFLAQGLAMMLTTINIGQLAAQVNAADCMLDFINTRFMLFSTYVSLGIEMSGLLHAVYLVQHVFELIAGKPTESKEPPKEGLTLILYWIRVLMSSAILGFAVAVTGDSLFAGVTGMWNGIPAFVALVIVVVLLCFVGIMEGMQIAAFAVVKLDENEYKDTHKIAHANCSLLFRGKNLGAFLIGRQICVTCCMFVAARAFSIDKAHPDIIAGRTSFDIPDGLQDFVNTGLLGALVTTILGSLMWRIIASSYPLAFMSNPIIFVIIKISHALEFTGIASASWLLANIQKMSVGLQADEVYLPVAGNNVIEDDNNL